jgi:hypothetical protein
MKSEVLSACSERTKESRQNEAFARSEIFMNSKQREASFFA